MKSENKKPIIIPLLYLVSGIIQTFLGLRFIFRLLNANRDAQFVQFLYRTTAFLLSPFRYIFPPESVEGAVFEWSTLVAMVLYSLATWIIVRLISIMFSATDQSLSTEQ